MKSSHKQARRRLGSFKKLADGTIKVTVRSGRRLDGGERSATGYAKDEDEAERALPRIIAQKAPTAEAVRAVASVYRAVLALVPVHLDVAARGASEREPDLVGRGPLGPLDALHRVAAL